MLNNVMVFIYNNDEQIEITDLLTELNFQCSLTKPYQEVTMIIPFGVFSKSIPSYYIDNGAKVEIYDLKSSCVFRGTVNKSTINAKNETLNIIAYDYIFNLLKSKVVYNFDNVSAYDAICKIFNDLNIPYSTNNGGFDGILGGKDSSDGKVIIKHLIKNKSAYDAIMMIATECYQKYGIVYYVYMDVSGNCNVTPADRYTANTTIKACKNHDTLDGNLIDCTYTRDSSEVITRVAVYDSKGNAVSVKKGKENISEDDGDE